MSTAVERLYLEIRKPAPPKPVRVEAPPPAPLDWWGVDAILRHTRKASPEELQEVIERAKEFRITTSQRNDIGVMLTVAQAQRDRPAANPTSDFLFNVLRVTETPAGLLFNSDWVVREIRAGAQAIENCRGVPLIRARINSAARDVLLVDSRSLRRDKPRSIRHPSGSGRRLNKWSLHPDRKRGLGTRSRT